MAKRDETSFDFLTGREADFTKTAMDELADAPWAKPLVDNIRATGGKARVVCSGDSFTLGYGVDNDHTWCELLSVLDPRLEAVNMGQGGYGVDQAYLWYKRDGVKIEHQIQLLAFITDDFYRMVSDSFSGYGKPVLDVENGMLAVKNVPVPRRAYYFTRVTTNIRNLSDLRTVEFLTRVFRKIEGASADSHQLLQGQRDEQARKILHKIFEDLKRLNEQHSSKLVLVYLPTILELQGKGLQSWSSPEEWAGFLEEESSSLQIPLINLFPEFRSLTDNEWQRLFIPKGRLQYPGAEGHFTEAGNAFVASVIHDKVMNTLPSLNGH